MHSITRHLVSWQGRDREFLLHVPRHVASPVAAVLVFHGAGSQAEAMIEFSGMSDQAEESGFVVVYPEGTGRIPTARTWNTGARFLFAARQGIDDVGFIRELLRRLPELSGLSPQWIFGSGMSNGAAFCFRLAKALPRSLSALGTVAGCPMEAPPSDEFRPRIIHFHGTEDRFVPYSGGCGPQGFTRMDWPPVEDALRAWVGGPRNQPAREEWLSDQASDGTIVRRRAMNGEQVVLYTVRGGGHTWPGRRPPLPSLGRSTAQINATALIWDFFSKSLRPV